MVAEPVAVGAELAAELAAVAVAGFVELAGLVA